MVDVKEGDNLTSRKDLSRATIIAYGTAACDHANVHWGTKFSIKAKPHHQLPPESLDPFITAILDQRGVWHKEVKKPEPLSSEILEVLYDQKLQNGLLAKEAAIFDWTALGCCTGSRISEYGQTKVKKGHQWNTIPISPDIAEEWRGKPIAFIAEDFQFFTADGIRLSDAEVIFSSDKAEYLWVRFRFDKGKANFRWRKFRRIKNHFLDPVSAGLSIRKRALYLRLDADMPLGAYAGKRKAVLFIKDSDMNKAFQAACEIAHPDEQHYLRIRIKHLTSHSIRVTAAVALDIAGVDFDSIKFRLRWDSDAVKEYVRDAIRKVNVMTLKSLQGAYEPN